MYYVAYYTPLPVNHLTYAVAAFWSYRWWGHTEIVLKNRYARCWFHPWRNLHHMNSCLDPQQWLVNMYKSTIFSVPVSWYNYAYAAGISIFNKTRYIMKLLFHLPVKLSMSVVLFFATALFLFCWCTIEGNFSGELYDWHNLSFLHTELPYWHCVNLDPFGSEPCDSTTAEGWRKISKGLVDFVPWIKKKIPFVGS